MSGADGGSDHADHEPAHLGRQLDFPSEEYRMSFLRALRAYIGLGPDDEIEDRYLSELNARRRELELDQLYPDRGSAEKPASADRPARRTGRDVAETMAARRTGSRPDRRPPTPPADPFERSAPALGPAEGVDEIDLAFIDGLEGSSGGHRGRHDIEADAALEPVFDDGGGATVRIRAPEDEIVEPEAGAVVRSLDSMRAKPRTLIPESFAEAKLVADEFKRDIPVLLNLQSLDRELARRLIDFASGICYVLDGSMEKIASQVFLLIPDSVEVSDEDRRRIEERGYAR